MITFRDGPTERRAGLTGGPDVWALAMWIVTAGNWVAASSARGERCSGLRSSSGANLR
jgi:hypothetical protein